MCQSGSHFARVLGLIVDLMPLMMRVQTRRVVADLLLRLSCQDGLFLSFSCSWPGSWAPGVMSPASPGARLPVFSTPTLPPTNPPGIAMLIDRSVMRASMMMISRNEER